ncbi:glycoside hydrolase family 2 protein [Pedobacter paludis]|uniref:Glycoside hydrolase family 2 n=1 Tax=Pedobacter paludis TaxID=2203212 RepID=A0A317EZ38_9SPHI|nr:sugar-binding domain-containing protein [Pedobacter paludis]PWS32240.1 glycoside hydrolase family 2 [Pedobacter paludis]
MKKISLLLHTIVLLTSSNLWAQANRNTISPQLKTRWTNEVGPESLNAEYPRPQLTRNSWTNLNGQWDYTITKTNEQPTSWQGKILVPYPIESSLSRVKKNLKVDEALWYKRTFNSTLSKGKRLLLHFGAVDQLATVFINGKKAGEHAGGYTAFTFDISDLVKEGNNELTVKVLDPTDRGIYPHGKQVSNPANIYYTASSGIWQTVWLETVPDHYISDIKMTPDIDRGVLYLTVTDKEGNGEGKNGAYTVSVMDKREQVAMLTGQTGKLIEIPIKDAKLWSPSSPHLYDLTIKMGEDEVKSYFGMRKISVARDEQGIERIMLNNKPYFNLGTLDQGFWPDGLYTAPTDEALAFDIKAIKAMGFNTIRKHIKVEPARWYYHADKIGMLVWQDMVNPHQGLPEGAKKAFEQQSRETIDQLKNSPSIVAWVLFNEKWGSYDQQRLTDWIKETDPSRLVNGHSGEILYVNEKLRSPSPNAYVSASMTDVHAYPNPMMPLKQPGKAQVVGEFGGIGVFVPGHQWNTNTAWGYIQEKPAALITKYSMMNLDLQLMRDKGLSGSIYTQPFDVEGEQNGLITYDREIIKIPFEKLREIHAALNPDIGRFEQVNIKEMDLTDPVEKYEKSYRAYLSGHKENSSIVNLAEMAKQSGDNTAVRLLTEDFIKEKNTAFSDEDLRFIYHVSESVSDPGFTVILQQREKLNVLMGGRKADNKIMNALYRDHIEPYATLQNGPDWKTAEEKITPYGTIGKEILLRAKTIHYLNKKDWDSYRPVAREYLKSYAQYLTSNEKHMLEKALDNP